VRRRAPVRSSVFDLVLGLLRELDDVAVLEEDLA
jgi:hypothetical protein